jgi:membrane-bound lytic murein transglycosylase D
VSALRCACAGALALLLAACSLPAPRPAPPAPVPVPVPAVPPVEPAPLPSAPVVATPAADASPWQRLRARFELEGCDYRPEVQRRAREYTRSPSHFAASWRNAMPFLLLVLDELERRDLPGELAMVPYVESGYRPLAKKGNVPAGMWQLMPATARGQGLVVRGDHDDRLDAIASTRAALDLLERYERMFEDWRLADMAFNSGEFRVRKLVGARGGDKLGVEELARLPLSPTTHQHLDRVLALSCIVADPGRHGVVLPEPDEHDRLQAVELEASMDLRLAARLAGLPADELRRWNAAHPRDRMAPDLPHRLLLPATVVARFEANAANVPPALWADWREQRAGRSGAIAGWAGQFGIPVGVLALANALEPEASVAPSTRLLLPGKDAAPIGDAETAVTPARDHVVVAGDTLSGIARRHAIPLRELRRLNPRANGTLRIGQSLRLSPGAD